jgi:vacuolar-type H+-ATPase subunit H
MKQKTARKKNAEQKDTATTAENAMHQVLEAEDNARQAVQDCARDAENILRDARATAKRIVERADQRIGLIHHRTSAALAATTSELERDQQLQASTFSSTAVDMDAVAAMVEQITELLTSGGH